MKMLIIFLLLASAFTQELLSLIDYPFNDLETSVRNIKLINCTLETDNISQGNLTLDFDTLKPPVVTYDEGNRLLNFDNSELGIMFRFYYNNLSNNSTVGDAKGRVVYNQGLKF